MIPFSIFPMQDVIMVSIQEEIDDRHISSLVKQLSTMVQTIHVKYVIIDLHEVEAVDTYLAGEIERLASTLYFLRATTIVVGLSVPVVLTLLDFGIRFHGVAFALDVEQALERIQDLNAADVMGMESEFPAQEESLHLNNPDEGSMVKS